MHSLHSLQPQIYKQINQYMKLLQHMMYRKSLHTSHTVFLLNLLPKHQVLVSQQTLLKITKFIKLQEVLSRQPFLSISKCPTRTIQSCLLLTASETKIFCHSFLPALHSVPAVGTIRKKLIFTRAAAYIIFCRPGVPDHCTNQFLVKI